MDLDVAHNFDITALASAITIASPIKTGSALNREEIILRIKDNSTARALTWNTIFRGVGVDLPTTTVVGKEMYAQIMYNDTDIKWDVTDVKIEDAV